MSHTMHAYFLVKDFRCNQEWVFSSISELFSGVSGLIFSKESDPFDGQECLSLNFDGYWVSVFYDCGQQIKDGFSSIRSSDTEISSRIRVVFGPDEEGAFNDVTVITYSFLLKMENVLVYDVNQNEVVES